jgi:hypothetical protein
MRLVRGAKHLTHAQPIALPPSPDGERGAKHLAQPIASPDIANTYPTEPMNKLRRIKDTQRQAIARRYDVSTETIRRWTRLIEENSLEWVRCSPGGKTPRYLHPFQTALLELVLDHRDRGAAWIENALLHNPQWTYQAWQNSHQHTA